MEITVMNVIWLLFLITIIFIIVYKKLTKNPDGITSKYEAEKNIDGNPADNLKIIMEALINAGFKKVGLDKDENRFYAQTKFSMSSFSEYIEVSFRQDHFSTYLKFKSICAFPIQVIAWGKNKRNYKNFEKELEKLMPIQQIIN